MPSDPILPNSGKGYPGPQATSWASTQGLTGYSAWLETEYGEKGAQRPTAPQIKIGRCRRNRMEYFLSKG